MKFVLLSFIYLIRNAAKSLEEIDEIPINDLKLQKKLGLNYIKGGSIEEDEDEDPLK